MIEFERLFVFWCDSLTFQYLHESYKSIFINKRDILRYKYLDWQRILLKRQKLQDTKHKQIY